MSARLMPAVALTLALVAACGEDPVQPASQRPDITPAEGLTEVEAVTLFLGITRLSFDGVNTVLPGMIPCPQGGQEELIEEFRDDRDGERDVIFTILPTRCEMGGREQYVRRGREPQPHDPDAHRDRTGWVRRVRRHHGHDIRWPQVAAATAVGCLSDPWYAHLVGKHPSGP